MHWMHGLELKVPPPIVALGVGWMMWLLRGQDPILPLTPSLRVGLALGVLIVGLGLELSAVVAFRKKKTTVSPFSPQSSSSLVQAGVYRWTRNPMYLGMALLLCAWGILLGSWTAWFGPLLFAGYITRFQIVPEERALKGLFGAAFDAYSQEVRRWF